MTERPAALILDFGGVLTLDFWEALAGFCRREGLAPDALAKAVSGDGPAHAALVDLERGAIRQGDFAAVVAPVLGVGTDGLLARMAAGLQPDEDMIEAAAAIRASGVPVGILSNSWGTEPFNPYAGWGLDENYDDVVISDQVGLRKPDPAIYRLAVERLGVSAERCVFVDDVAAYLVPAREMGMTVVHQVDTRRTISQLSRLFDVAMAPAP